MLFSHTEAVFDSKYVAISVHVADDQIEDAFIREIKRWGRHVDNPMMHKYAIQELQASKRQIQELPYPMMQHLPKASRENLILNINNYLRTCVDWAM